MRWALTIGVLFTVCNLSAGVKKPVVVVEPFKVRAGSGATEAFVETLHDRILDTVQNTRKFEVVERDQLSKLLEEIRLAQSGLTDGEEIEGNKLKCAGFKMYGTIMRFRVPKPETVADLGVTISKATVEIHLRFARIEDGKILGTKTVTSVVARNSLIGEDKSDAVQAEATRVAARDVVNALVERAFPTKVLSVNSNYVTINMTAEQVEQGQVLEVFEVGDEITDPDTGEPLGVDEDIKGRIVVSRPGAKFSKCTVVSPLKLEDVEKGMIVRVLPEKSKVLEKSNKRQRLLDEQR